MLLAVGGYSIIQLILIAIVLAGAFGILFVVLRQTGVEILSGPSKYSGSCSSSSSL